MVVQKPDHFKTSVLLLYVMTDGIQNASLTPYEGLYILMYGKHFFLSLYTQVTNSLHFWPTLYKVILGVRTAAGTIAPVIQKKSHITNGYDLR